MGGQTPAAVVVAVVDSEDFGGGDGNCTIVAGIRSLAESFEGGVADLSKTCKGVIPELRAWSGRRVVRRL